jgi:hypothetical protein
VVWLQVCWVVACVVVDVVGFVYGVFLSVSCVILFLVCVLE